MGFTRSSGRIAFNVGDGQQRGRQAINRKVNPPFFADFPFQRLFWSFVFINMAAIYEPQSGFFVMADEYQSFLRVVSGKIDAKVAEFIFIFAKGASFNLFFEKNFNFIVGVC